MNAVIYCQNCKPNWQCHTWALQYHNITDFSSLSMSMAETCLQAFMGGDTENMEPLHHFQLTQFLIEDFIKRYLPHFLQVFVHDTPYTGKNKQRQNERMSWEGGSCQFTIQ